MAYLFGGRVNQKLLTRMALVEVAAQMIRERKRFTVADVADLAKVGRTTAYRYFPTLGLLLAHAALWAVTEAEKNRFENALKKNETFHERLKSFVEVSDKSTVVHEAEHRTMLRLSLEQKQADGDGKEENHEPGGVIEQRLDSEVGDHADAHHDQARLQSLAVLEP